MAHVASDPILQLQLVLVELFIVREVHGSDEEMYVFAIEALCVETFSDELSDEILAHAGLSVEAEDESLGRLPLAHMRPEGQRHHRMYKMLAEDMFIEFTCGKSVIMLYKGTN